MAIMQQMSTAFRRFLAIGATMFALVAASATPAPAQVHYPLDAPGAWKPWKFAAAPFTRKEQAATPAEVKAFEAELLGLQAILRRAPGAATPLGFSVETWENLDGNRASAPDQPPAKALPLAGALTFGAFPIFEYERGGKTIREDTGETFLMGFHVNQIQPGLIRGEFIHDWNGFDTDVFVQPAATGEAAGYPRFGDIIVIKKNPASLWTPVSLEAALRITAAAQQRDLDTQQETVTKFRARLDDLRNPAKRAAKWEGYKKSAPQMPNPAAYLAEMEKVEKIEDASLVSELSPQGGVMKTFLAAERALNDTNARIAGLSPEDRTAAGCYAKAGTSLRSRFRSGVAPGCGPIVRPNWQYFNKALPRSAPQLIVVDGIVECFDKAPTPGSKNTAAGCPANRKLLQTMDKQAVLDWLR
jgi:hypothetical protein